MEMPKGWKRHCDLKYADHQVDIDRIDAGILLKEMAEALEKYERQSDDGRPGYIPPQCEALKKFKEWK